MSYFPCNLSQLPRSYYLNSQNSLRSQYSSPEPCDHDSFSRDQGNTSNVVEEIISDKFNGTICRLKRRSLERRKSRKNYYNETVDEKFSYQNDSDDSGLNASSFEDFPTENATSSRDQSKTYWRDQVKSSHVSLTTLNAKTADNPLDLMVNARALPPKCYANRPFTKSTEYSIGSSNISSLVSTQCPSGAIYENISKSDQQLTKRQQITECIDNESTTDKKIIQDERKGKLIKNIILELETILQISKALNLYYNRTGFLDKTAVEAEKLLLISKQKKSMLEKLMHQETSQQPDDVQIFSNVTIKNLVFNLNPKMHQKHFKRYTWHFICVATMGSTFMSSDVSIDQEAEVLKCEKPFVFPRSKEFEISVSLYAIPVKVKKEKSCLKIRPRQTRKTINATDLVRESLFKLWGSTTINSLRFKQKYFQLAYVHDDAAILDYFTADIENVQELNIESRGFLTIGRIHLGYPVMDTRWCLLQGFYLKYWNSPNEDLVSEPLRVLDLRHCTKIEINKQGYIFPNRKNICLEFNTVSGNGVAEYYLFADTDEEFNRWERTLNKAYSAMKKDCYIF